MKGLYGEKESFVRNRKLNEEQERHSVYQVFLYLLNKVKDQGIDVVEDYAFLPLDDGSTFPSVLIFFDEKMGGTVLALNANSTLQEKTKSLACCFVFWKTPGGWKKEVQINGQYFWLESICGKRDPEIDRRADRYISLLLHRNRRQSEEKQCKGNPSIKTA